MTKAQKTIEEQIRILGVQIEHLEKQVRCFVSVLEQHQQMLEGLLKENDTVIDK